MNKKYTKTYSITKNAIKILNVIAEREYFSVSSAFEKIIMIFKENDIELFNRYSSLNYALDKEEVRRTRTLALSKEAYEILKQLTELNHLNISVMTVKLIYAIKDKDIETLNIFSKSLNK